MTIPVELAGVSGILSVSGISRKWCEASPSSSLNLKASFVQPLSLASARQLSWQESPWQRGLVFDETDLRFLENVTECQSLPCQGRWHRAKRRCRRGCTEQHLRYPAHSKGVLCCPTSQALARQLPWQGSPWQRGFVFDETDLRLPENVTECQSLSLWERWHCEAMTERARMLTKNKKHSDTHPACQSHRIAVLSCFILPGLPSQALARQLSQRESPWQGGQALVYASMPWSAGG